MEVSHNTEFGRSAFTLWRTPTIHTNYFRKVLIQKLKELGEAGIIIRKAFSEKPPRVEYGLTPYGHTMEPLLGLLSAWGTTHLSHQIQPQQDTGLS